MYIPIDLQVCIVNDPRAKNPYNKLYTVEYLNNMTGGQPVLYINQPVSVLKQLTVKSLKEGEVGINYCQIRMYSFLSCLWNTINL